MNTRFYIKSITLGLWISLAVSAFSQEGEGWERMADMPVATGWYGSCLDSIGEKVYVFGGSKALSTYVFMANTQIYDLRADSWTQGAAMPYAAGALGAEMIDSAVYTLGGGNDPQILNHVMKYNPVSDTWDTLIPLPGIVYSYGSCVYKDSIYVFGGRDENFDLRSTTWVYDPVSDTTWHPLPDMPVKKTNSSVCVYKNDIYLFGENPALKYNPAGKTWTEIHEAPTDVWGAAIPVLHNDTILLFGGNFHGNGSYPPASNTIYTFDPESESFTKMNNMPFARSARGYKVGNFVYIFGGQYGASLASKTNEVWRFNLDSLKPFISVAGVSLDKNSLELLVSETKTLVATINPADASDPSLSWHSSDFQVASVDSDGTVTGYTVGTVEIYVTTEDGQFTDSCHVEVGSTGTANRQTDQVTISPNPSYDLLTIQGGMQASYSVEINSLNGQLIYSTKIEGASHQIDLSSFQKGVYLITIKSKDFVAKKKIIKL